VLPGLQAGMTVELDALASAGYGNIKYDLKVALAPEEK
jgi:hypothetical protein